MSSFADRAEAVRNGNVNIVEKYIEGTPEVGSVGVHVDDTNRPKKSTDVIKCSNNEDSTLTEGTLFLKFMEVLLSSTRSGSEKKKILEEEFGVAMSEELEREVLEVCNLSQGVRAEGREEGRQEGRIEGIGIGEIRMLVQLVREGDLPLERAAAKAKMTVEQFKETMENTPLQAV